MKRIFSLLLCVILACSFAISAFADSVEYTTEGGTWAKINDSTWVMDRDGDGKQDVTLVKEGNEWAYYFEVADLDAKYYAWENEVPDGYEVVGKGTRPDPAYIPDPIKYSHTDNLDDTGAGTNNYGNNVTKNEVVTLLGATSLEVTIKYQTESISYDWVCVWAGAQPTYTAASNYNNSVSGKLGGTTLSEKTYTIDGDSVTFGFRSDSSSCNYYGYYAVVKGIGLDTDTQLTITNKEKDVDFKKGGFTLSKVLAESSDTVKNFEFDIELSTHNSNLEKFLAGSQTFGDLMFKDGKAKTYLKSGETVQINDIPVGVDYKITENNVSDYGVAWQDSSEGSVFSSTIQSEDIIELICTNEEKTVEEDPVPTVDLVLKKEAVGDVFGQFDFHVVLFNLKPNTSYKYDAQTFVSDAIGMADVSLKLSVGDIITFKELPVNAQFQILESENDYVAGYEISGLTFCVSDSAENVNINQSLSTSKESISENDEPVIVFTNKGSVPSEGLDVSVEKQWVDNDNAKNIRPEYITVYLIDDGNVVRSTRLDESNNWSDVFKDLPKFREDGVTECEYTLSELQVPGYVSIITSTTDTDFVITNTISDVGDLFISKTLEDADRIELSDKLAYGLDLSFDFEVSLKLNNKPVSGVFSLDSDKGTKTGSIVFDENGVAKVSLKHDESIYIKNLPAGCEYVVIESIYEDFEAVENNIIGIIAKDHVEEVNVVNKVVDSMQTEMPETGGSGVIGIMVGGIGLLFVGVLILYKLRKGRVVE